VSCSWESPFANCLAGAPGSDYLSRAIVNCRGSTHCGHCVHGTHLLPIDHDHWNDRTPATRTATGIKPVAASLANAPPTATPSSVMGPFGRCGARKKLAGYRLVADDAPWAAGQGLEICGPIGALLLLLTGRPAALPQLSGPGATGLRELLAPSSAA
jgi:hypothetical protein